MKRHRRDATISALVAVSPPHGDDDSDDTEHSAKSQRTEETAPGSQEAGLLDFCNTDLLWEIGIHVDKRSLPAWFSTHPLIYAASNDECAWKARCMAEFGYLIGLELNPILSSSRLLTWKDRYRLLQRHPSRLLNRTLMDSMSLEPALAETEERLGTLEVDESGLLHTNIDEWTNVLANHPFLTSLRPCELAALLDPSSPVSANPALVLKSGYEYFEMTVIRNTREFNRATAIAVSGPQMSRYSGFIGWNPFSVAYHSDDGTIRSIFILVGPTFTTGAVVGCGLDWERKEVFFTLNGRFVVAVEKELTDFPWFPAVGTMCIGDQVLVNFGRQPFKFDMRQYRTARAAQLQPINMRMR